jgi:hypothetical protein
MEKRDYGKEILEDMTFEEAKEMLTPLMQSRIEKKKALERTYHTIKRVVKKHHAPDTFEYNFCIDAVWLLKGADEDLENQKQLDSLEYYYRWNESRQPQRASRTYYSWQDNSSLIQLAKQIPIENLYKNPLKQSGSKRLVGICPFRQERKASFTIYTDSNTFYCFGCHDYGDSITFYQKLYGISFWDTVKQLTGTY